MIRDLRLMISLPRFTKREMQRGQALRSRIINRKS